MRGRFSCAAIFRARDLDCISDVNSYRRLRQSFDYSERDHMSSGCDATSKTTLCLCEANRRVSLERKLMRDS